MEKIARHLLSIQAVTLSPKKPYQWASGILSPIYTDNRLTLSYPKVRGDIETELSMLIKREYPDVEVIMGTATAGIAHAALVASILDLPMGYVRAQRKTHGKTNAIEGVLKPGQKVVVVEDLISTGMSSLDVVDALREAGADVLGVVSIFTYQFKVAEENFKKANLRFHALTNYQTLINVAKKENLVTSDEFKALEAWYKNPQAWLR